MIENTLSIPISYIKQYHFCPRVIYFLFSKIEIEKPQWVSYGKEYHHKHSILEKRRTLKRYNLTNAIKHNEIELRSKLGFHGKADMILENDDNIMIVEYKTSFHNYDIGTIDQIVLYSIASEEKFKKKCTTGFVCIGEKAKAYKLEITQEKKQHALKSMERVKHLLLDNTIPDSDASDKKCMQCEFINFCNDRF